MELTLRKVRACREAMKVLMTVADEKMTARIGYRLAKISKELKPHQELIDETIRKIWSKHGVLNEETKNYEIKPGTPADEAAGKELNELLDTTVEISIQPVEIPEDVGGIPPGVWIDLEGMVTTKG